ncbi:hypothetical protein HUK80_17795 [Flavobacterium sp. MAH-1]|uniref:Uncharacterized protein n=1 Tax=Flavobacterium agri TaxID=2743471 RepID=A0A7Y9C7V9_9FLAO|nr:hypothetical protein [Flavobacterium agri]NUY82761.1 hypothetical protein [Flavobacterium agri]NYA72784.1 hypothetical protein [Flavobacterium agri]
MSDKQIVFDLYRFHLHLIESDQIVLFPNQYTKDELLENKNAILYGILENLYENVTDFPIIQFNKNDETLIFGVANKKKLQYYQNFQKHSINSEPFVYVIINTNPESQKVGVSRNVEAFTSESAAINVLLRVFNKYLKSYGLKISFEKIYDKKEFWSLLKQYSGKIKMLRFEIIKPNMSSISSSIKDYLKPLIEKTNSQTTKISLEADKGETLDKITPKNEQLNSLVEYTSEGGGNVVLRVNDQRKLIKSSDLSKTLVVPEASLKGSELPFGDWMAKFK